MSCLFLWTALTLSNDVTYFDCAAKQDAATMAASCSNASWESKPLIILWWTFLRSDMIRAACPSVLVKVYKVIYDGVFLQYTHRDELKTISMKNNARPQIIIII